MLARSELTIDHILEQLGDGSHLHATIDPTMAAALTRREAPDRVIIDACAPDHAAWRALTSLQPDGVLEGTSVLLIAQDGALNAVELGSFGVLTKPIFLERATDAILAHMSGVENGLVLIADEDTHIREILRDALESGGCTTVLASDGVEALRIATTRKPDVVLLSLTLRVTNGVVTLANMRHTPALARTPILMLVPRELTQEQMAQLHDSVVSITASGEVAARPVVDIVRDALAADDLELTGTNK